MTWSNAQHIRTLYCQCTGPCWPDSVIHSTTSLQATKTLHRLIQCLHALLQGH